MPVHEINAPGSRRLNAAGPRLRGAALFCLVLLMLCANLRAEEADASAAEDSRQVYGPTSPHWLQAVGKLRVPGSRYVEGRRQHYIEDCSATLVARRADLPADTLITAWHCLEFYDDLSRPILFNLPPLGDSSTAYQAYRVADGGGMTADWAILRLYEKLPADRATPLLITVERADASRHITMAGYSRDAALGAHGLRLTYDPRCRITAQDKRRSNSDCRAYKGASGGAVVQVSAAGIPHLSGVISEGNSENLSIYVPVSRFKSAVIRHIR